MGSSEKGETGKFWFAQGRRPASRTALINHLARVYDLDSFLEIGVRRKAKNFARIEMRDRVGVDPDPAAEADHVMTSDEYFARHCHRQFDLVFIDGLHTGEQVKRDIENALAHLAPGGFVLTHDMNPPTAFHARETYEVDGTFPPWNGTSWQGYAQLRKSRDDLEMMVVDTDWGVGVIRPGWQQTIDCPIDSYDDLAANRGQILNLVSVAEFLALHPPRQISPLARLGRWLTGG
ncbi:MAG: hypothetical protein BroJett030_29050 [Alphaproteobacteria bacterium]|nr:MAG: hypothetical protein BroJett030_29050 [Alphaproteobacteria bacterium]